MRPRKVILTLGVLPRLGFDAIVGIGIYRLSKWLGLYERKASLPLFPLDGGFFSRVEILPAPSAEPEQKALCLSEATRLLTGEINFFDAHALPLGSPPDWFLNPFTGMRHSGAHVQWTRIPDFDPVVGDIKIYWEASRFRWAPLAARAARLSGERRYLELLENWTQDWTLQNEFGLGPQWKCGQETALRLLHLLLARFLLGGTRIDASETALMEFIRRHCLRIESTLRYAKAQKNNHALSEAVGLFVGGIYLANAAHPHFTPEGVRWRDLGKASLEQLVPLLFEEDGTFSQYSVNYHRMALDLLSHAEVMREVAGQAPFSVRWYARAEAATKWLQTFVCPHTGAVPNLGANDGSRVLVLDSLPIRDFRPSVQLAARLFLGGCVLARGPWDEPLDWLKLGRKHDLKVASESLHDFPDGGFTALRVDRSRLFIRGGRFRFRPGQADVFHVDLWNGNANVLRDAGSYGYAAAEASDFSGVMGHNTISFDEHDQMPRIGRFLYAKWLRSEVLEGPIFDGKSFVWRGRYQDAWGCRHERSVRGGGTVWEVEDRVEGFRESATLRWHLAPSNWSLSEGKLISPLGEVSFEAESAELNLALMESFESLHYLQKKKIPVLVARVSAPTVIRTTIRLGIEGN